jgi:hypothetical protein
VAPNPVEWGCNTFLFKQTSDIKQIMTTVALICESMYSRLLRTGFGMFHFDSLVMCNQGT